MKLSKVRILWQNFYLDGKLTVSSDPEIPGRLIALLETNERTLQIDAVIIDIKQVNCINQAVDTLIARIAEEYLAIIMKEKKHAESVGIARVH